MNKGIVIAVIVLVIIGGWWWYSHGTMTNNNTSTSTSPATTATQTKTSGTAGNGTIKSLLSSKTPIQCSFAMTDANGGKNDGTVYVTNGKMRGDFTTVVAGTTTKSHLINDGKNIYLWIDGMTRGYRTPTAQAPSTGAINGGPNMNQPIDYTCTPWTVYSNLFALPLGVTFN